MAKENDNYSLNCSYYDNKFNTIDELLKSIQETGMDPNWEITNNGIGIGETAWELMEDTV